MITLAMKPTSKPRPRATARGGIARIYMPAPYKKWLAQFETAFYAEDVELPEGPLALHIIFNVGMAKSWSARKKREHRGQPHLNERLDIDNAAGAVMDAILPKSRGGDGRVYAVHALKYWADEDSIKVSWY